MDLNSLVKIKVDRYNQLKNRLTDIENEKQQLLQEALELQGAIKQLNDLIQIQKQENLKPKA